jgi:SAM-dependent methyltransferase
MNKDLEQKLIESFSPRIHHAEFQKIHGKKSLLQRRINKYEKCGMEMIEFVNSISPLCVLDLGCGDNQYKSFINNLVGIDLVNKSADIMADITNIPYDDNSVDVAICFGSINFGTEELIELQLLEMKRVLKTGGYAIFRGNMKDHDDSRDIYYGWSNERVHYWTEQLSLTLHEDPSLVTRTDRFGNKKEDWVDKVALKTNTERRSPYRLFWIWKK